MAARVLLLEDDPMIRELVGATLADEGYDVLACASYDDLLAAAERADGAIAVADFWGASHRALGADERGQVERLARAVPTILVTGRAWAEGLPPSAHGLAGVLPKPFDLDRLVEAVALAAGMLA